MPNEKARRERASKPEAGAAVIKMPVQSGSPVRPAGDKPIVPPVKINGLKVQTPDLSRMVFISLLKSVELKDGKASKEQIEALTKSELRSILKELDAERANGTQLEMAAAVINMARGYGVLTVTAAPVSKAKAKDQPKVARTPKVKAEPKQCKCGCGEMTKGGLFRPGHDARWHSAQKGGPKGGSKVPKLCKCGCGKMTKGGTWMPGHDAQHYSRLLHAERIKAGQEKAGTVGKTKDKKKAKAEAAQGGAV